MLTRDELDKTAKDYEEMAEDSFVDSDAREDVLALLSHIDAQRTLIAEMAAVFAKYRSHCTCFETPIGKKFCQEGYCNICDTKRDAAAVLAKAKEVG